MDIRTTYQRVAEEPVTLTTARTVAALWGRWCVITLTTYCLPDGTTISVALRPAERSEAGSDGLVGVPDGMLRLSDGRGGAQRIIEQRLVVRPRHDWLMPLSEEGGGVEAGRRFAERLTSGFQSLFEGVRQDIRRNLAAGVREKATAELEQRFGEQTRQVIRRLPGELHWRLLLQAADFDEESLRVIEDILTHNSPRFHELADDAGSDIPTLSSEGSHLDADRIAQIKAIALLERVCGSELASEFRARKTITVKSGGYRFIVAPGQMVECFDPAGRRAMLCVHTDFFSSHPIDELVIAYLNIRHRLREFLRTANILGREPGFRADPLAVEQPASQLHDAIRRDDLDAAKAAIAQGESLEVRDGEGQTPLSHAISRGRVGIVRLLLGVGADPHDRNEHGGTLLHLAAAGTSADIVELLLNCGLDPNAGFPHNPATPLFFAAQSGEVEIARRLLAHGADVNARDRLGLTPLHMAARHDRREMTEWLIANGAAVDAKAADGATPLLWTARRPSDRSDTVRILLAHGASVDAIDAEGCSALHYASRLGFKPMVQLLISHGAAVDRRNSQGTSPLHLAARHGHLPVVRLLLHKGADVNAKDSQGITPLLSAAAKPHQRLVKLLLDRGADPNIAARDGWTAPSEALGKTSRSSDAV